MRFLKLSTMLIVVLCLLVVNVSAETLQEALRAGTFNGKLSYMMVKGSDEDTYSLNGIRNRDSSAVTAHLNYESGAFYKLKFGMSFEASHDLTSSDDATPEGEKDGRVAISTAMMHQVYLQYDFFKKSNLKVGRQIIHSPLLNSSEWPFPMIDTWDAAVLTTAAIPDTVIKAMYVKEWNPRDSNVDGIDSIHFSDPLLSVFVKNSSIKGLTLIGQYLTTSEDFDGVGNNGDMPVLTYDGWSTYLLEGNYLLPIQQYLELSVKYGGASFDQDNQESTNFIGARLNTAFTPYLAFEAAYTSVDDENTFPGSYGHVPNSVFYNNTLMFDSLFAGTDTYSLKIGRVFGEKGKGLTVSLIYTKFKQSDEGIANLDMFEKVVDGISEFDLNVRYGFSGSLEGLSLQAIAGYAQDVPASGPPPLVAMMPDETDATYIRFLAKYEF